MNNNQRNKTEFTIEQINFSTGMGFFVQNNDKMIQDDAKSIVLWRFSYTFVPYHDGTII
jgi:hypothetical protein